MASAHVEIDGMELTLDEYESYVINTGPVEIELGIDPLALLNKKFGYPDKNGAML